MQKEGLAEYEGLSASRALGSTGALSRHQRSAGLLDIDRLGSTTTPSCNALLFLKGLANTIVGVFLLNGICEV